MTIEIKSSLKRTTPDARRIKTECHRALKSLGIDTGRLTLGVHYVGTKRIRSLNRTYRGIDAPTDVLSFGLYHNPAEFPKEGPILLGDIVICPQCAEKDALSEGVGLSGHLTRLLIHGLLHLLGYDHEQGPAKARKMFDIEQKLLKGRRAS